MNIAKPNYENLFPRVNVKAKDSIKANYNLYGPVTVSADNAAEKRTRFPRSISLELDNGCDKAGNIEIINEGKREDTAKGKISITVDGNDTITIKGRGSNDSYMIYNSSTNKSTSNKIIIEDPEFTGKITLDGNSANQNYSLSLIRKTNILDSNGNREYQILSSDIEVEPDVFLDLDFDIQELLK